MSEARMIGSRGPLPMGYDTPAYIAEMPNKPSDLTGIASDEWDRICPILMEYGVVTKLDASTIADYCRWYQIQQEYMIEFYKLHKDADGNMRRILITKTKRGGYQPTPYARMLKDATDIVERFRDKLAMNPKSRLRVVLQPPPIPTTDKPTKLKAVNPNDIAGDLDNIVDAQLLESKQDDKTTS